MHQKHAKLSRPNYGEFARNEWAIIGTPCGVIQKLSFGIIKDLSQKWKLGYVDADHKSGDEESENGRDQSSAMAFGAKQEYTDKITFHRFDREAELGRFQFRQYFNEIDGVIVNGNHFIAKNQIVVIDPKKEASLKKKLDRLTNVELILLQEGTTEVFSFIKEHLENYDQIPVFKITETNKIQDFFQNQLENSIPSLNGLVLAGGKSVRMGKDKGAIEYHGKSQRDYLYELIEPLCSSTFLSLRENQGLDTNLPVIEDSFKGLGPFGAILSAFKEYPDNAWLVVACDLPLLNKDSLNYLIANRNPSSIATTFHSPVTNFPEPLITIWEPRSYPILFQFLAQGYSCPRKVLINSEIELLKVPDAQVLKNVNTEEEMKEVRKLMKGVQI